MLQQEFIEEYQISYVRASEPFSLKELLTLIRPASGISEVPLVTKAVILDLRLVHMARITESEIRRHLIKKAALGVSIADFPCAYVVKDLKDYSKIRMASMFSDLTGVTSEKSTFISESLGAAIAWLAAIDAKDAADLVLQLENTNKPPYISTP